MVWVRGVWFDVGLDDLWSCSRPALFPLSLAREKYVESLESEIILLVSTFYNKVYFCTAPHVSSFLPSYGNTYLCVLIGSYFPGAPPGWRSRIKLFVIHFPYRLSYATHTYRHRHIKKIIVCKFALIDSALLKKSAAIYDALFPR